MASATSRSEVDIDSSEQVFDEGLQVESSKSLERKMQWEEEVHIIHEEMQQTIVYYKWKQQWWLKQNLGPTTNEDTIQHGISAYSRSKHIIASVWPRVLLWPGYPFCNWRA